MEVFGADVFMINGKNLLYVVQYHSKFQIVKKVNSLSADDLVQKTKLIFVENRFPKKIVSGVGTNFTVERLKDFCRELNIL